MNPLFIINENSTMNKRLNNLRDSLKDKKLDSFLISDSANRGYISGFSGSAGYLLITQHNAILATDFRYIEQAGLQAPDFRTIRIASGYAWLLELLQEVGAKTLGVESEDMSLAMYRNLDKVFRESSIANNRKIKLVPTSGLVEKLRVIKDSVELELLQSAITIADRALDAIAPTIKVGQTEREVAWHLEMAMREMGADGISFDTIVGSGPNGALPHHRPNDRQIQEGEPIVIDMGAKYHGYCSDMTRTIILGNSDETFRRVYDTVLGAQLTAIATIQTGMTGLEADALARQVIETAGYGDYFGHSLGHGVGLAVHEDPKVGPMSQDILEEGMIFTIEPGIYISGWGGVRIEDVVILEKTGARTLSRAIKSERIGSC
jgi:Xaa-Pro aminopeptidase